MNWIELTWHYEYEVDRPTNGDEKLFVNAERIEAIHRTRDVTTVRTFGNTLEVKETPQEIMELMAAQRQPQDSI
jgi:uncharacterized protein YlzI (FlbEa/FlbD family)